MKFTVSEIEGRYFSSPTDEVWDRFKDHKPTMRVVESRILGLDYVGMLTLGVKKYRGQINDSGVLPTLYFTSEEDCKEWVELLDEYYALCNFEE